MCSSNFHWFIFWYYVQTLQSLRSGTTNSGIISFTRKKRLYFMWTNPVGWASVKCIIKHMIIYLILYYTVLSQIYHLCWFIQFNTHKSLCKIKNWEKEAFSAAIFTCKFSTKKFRFLKHFYLTSKSFNRLILSPCNVKNYHRLDSDSTCRIYKWIQYCKWNYSIHEIQIRCD